MQSRGDTGPVTWHLIIALVSRMFIFMCAALPCSLHSLGHTHSQGAGWGTGVNHAPWKFSLSVLHLAQTTGLIPTGPGRMPCVRPLTRTSGVAYAYGVATTSNAEMHHNGGGSSSDVCADACCLIVATGHDVI